MPTTDEDILRELLHSATADLRAPGGVAAGIVARDRRRRRQAQFTSLAVAGVAAGTVAALAAQGGAAVAPAAGPSAHRRPAVRLTAAQQVRYQLSDAAAQQGAPAGRYVELTESEGDGVRRESVIDRQTGDTWTFQQGAGLPGELPVAPHFSPTSAELAAMPTDLAGLRAALLAQYQQQQATGLAEALQAAERNNPGYTPAQVKKAVTDSLPVLTPEDEVFLQATTDLWDPLNPPALRAALYKVLAATPGVVVNDSATDGLGRPAIEVSRVETGTGITDATFENAATGAVQESLFLSPPSGAGPDARIGMDLYLTVTSSNVAPTASGPGGR